MENLYKAYKNIFSKRGNWKYYRKKLDVKKLPLANENEAWNFIEKYYKAGEKNEVFDKDVDIKRLRNRHTVSVFFLGIFLSETVLGKSYKEGIEPDFRYLWFIASLYHDYSYLVEGNKKYRVLKYVELNEIYKRFAVTYKLLEGSSPLTFDRVLVKSYHKYRIQEHEDIDHGILGGILLYDRLRKNYDIAFKRVKGLKPNTPKEIFEFNGLTFSECQFDYFARVADTVITHNIWFCTKSADQTIYKEYGLENLIIKDKADEDKKHKRDNNPFLFLLILADTLEPIKRKEFEKYSAQELLEKINISISSDKIIVEVLDDTLEYASWFNSIKSLEDWMQVKVREDKNKISIKIN